jgi:ribosomal protein S18 acetylase RimI-like enzyme
MVQNPTAPTAFCFEPLGKFHDRTAFDSGVETLDRYFKTQATQDVRRRAAWCFVAIENKTGSLAGYYTLAANSIPLEALPVDIARKLPKYPLVPAVLLGRLAVSTLFQRRGIGSSCLADAARRIATGDLMAFALMVDAKDDAAQQFYQRHGFVSIIGQPMRLILRLATAMSVLGGEVA